MEDPTEARLEYIVEVPWPPRLFDSDLHVVVSVLLSQNPPPGKLYLNSRTASGGKTAGWRPGVTATPIPGPACLRRSPSNSGGWPPRRQRRDFERGCGGRRT